MLTFIQTVYELKAKVHFLVDPVEFTTRKRSTEYRAMPSNRFCVVPNLVCATNTFISAIVELESLKSGKAELSTRIQKHERLVK